MESDPTAVNMPDQSLPVESPAGWKRGFWSLIATQFQGALNENGLKQLVVFLVLGMGLHEAERDRLVLVIGALFSVPYILFSMSGGFLADHYSKRTIVFVQPGANDRKSAGRAQFVIFA
jgi:acyl-[acyl-carrier-protein]-phospholipid O-acyltransferase / long-chain-fatty-acid--[acyl-carrier-protein] ligase